MAWISVHGSVCIHEVNVADLSGVSEELELVPLVH